MTKVEILVQTITAQYGVLSAGDELTTSAEFAKHLVEDCGAAKYVKAPKAAEVETEEFEPDEGDDDQKESAATRGRQKTKK